MNSIKLDHNLKHLPSVTPPYSSKCGLFVHVFDPVTLCCSKIVYFMLKAEFYQY